jgi:4'-phosphopantetheinyl transferase EntD
MGLRGLERTLAAELCYEAVVRAVSEYLDECRAARRVLPALDYLIVPIIRQRCWPPRIMSVQQFIDRAVTEARAQASVGVNIEVILPDVDSFVEAIMAPYPIDRLRTAVLRRARQLSDGR